MDNDVVIRVEGLGKRYTLGASRNGGRYTALRDVIAEKAKTLLRKPLSRPSAGNSAPDETDFWALKDVSFEVRRGEVVGIIGRNGAGKSTLLKILSRITEPTEGRITLKGRVASLLEVGTGFHPELTGRENIFLNGAILGMHRAEIKAKFDEIVAFAEVERFLDTPVKRYSSGMYVRLAFAVAAHLEPEILIVDEVLAVGDTEFQKKCLGKMREVAKGDERTVLFVSHNMRAVQTLCDRGILLEQGNVVCLGAIEEVLNVYLTQQKFWSENLSLARSAAERQGNGQARFVLAYLEDGHGARVNGVRFGVPFSLNGMVRTFTDEIPFLSIAFSISKVGGDVIFTSHHHDTVSVVRFSRGEINWRANLDPNILKPGVYSICIGLTNADWSCIDYVPDCLIFEVLPISNQEGKDPLDRRPGLVLPPAIQWHVSPQK